MHLKFFRPQMSIVKNCIFPCFSLNNFLIFFVFALIWRKKRFFRKFSIFFVFIFPAKIKLWKNLAFFCHIFYKKIHFFSNMGAELKKNKLLYNFVFFFNSAQESGGLLLDTLYITMFQIWFFFFIGWFVVLNFLLILRTW